MVHRISDDVVALVRHDAIVKTRRGSSPGLQYILQNCGLRRVRVRVDFSKSEHVQVVNPDALDQGDSLVVTLDVSPLQRKHVCFVTRYGGAKAFVRVEYTIEERVTVEEDELARAHEQCEEDLRTAIQRSEDTFGGVYRESKRLLEAPAHADYSSVWWCADINRVSRKRGVKFVDPLFPPSAESLWGKQNIAHADAIARSISWRHLSEVIDEAWCFVDSNKEIPKLEYYMLGNESWVCAMDLLAEATPSLVRRWFGNSRSNSLKLFGMLHDFSVISVNLRIHGIQWVQVIIDLFIPILPAPSTSANFYECALMTMQPGSCSFYHILLHKAFAKLVGGYSYAATKCTQEILRTLGVETSEITLSTDAFSCDQKGKLQAYLLDHFKQNTARKIIVSFDEIENHHCSFLLTAVDILEDQLDTPTPHFIFRDSFGKLGQLAAAKLKKQFDVYSGNTCSLTTAEFFELLPRVFEVSLQPAHNILRRKIVAVVNNSQSSLKVAVSCEQLQKVIIEGLARSVRECGKNDYERVTLKVDRVDDDYNHHEVELEKLNDPTSIDCSSISSWVAMPGEFIISVFANSDNGIPIKLSSSNATANLDLLFRCLDEDMNSLVDLNDLLNFLRLHDSYTSVDDDCDATSPVSAFIREWGSAKDVAGRHGIRKSDLYDIYRAISQLDGSVPESSLIWRDLLLVLGIKQSEGVVNEVSVLLTELVCSIKTDHDNCSSLTAVVI